MDKLFVKVLELVADQQWSRAIALMCTARATSSYPFMRALVEAIVDALQPLASLSSYEDHPTPSIELHNETTGRAKVIRYDYESIAKSASLALLISQHIPDAISKRKIELIAHQTVKATKMMQRTESDNASRMARVRKGDSRQRPVSDDNDEWSPPLVEEAIRLDVAAKRRVIAYHPFEIAVAVRSPLSPRLTEKGLSNVKSVSAVLYRSESDEIVKLKLVVSSSSCTIDEAEVTMLFKSGQDSPVVYFTLIPNQIGKILITVRAFQEEYFLANQQISTTVVLEVRKSVSTGNEITLAESLQDTHLRNVVYEILVTSFSIDDLSDLCFRLQINWEDLKGETVSSKARSIVQYFSNRERLNILAAKIKTLRPRTQPFLP